MRTLMGWISHRFFEQIKPKHEEEELEKAASVDIDVAEDAQRAQALLDQVYEEDVAKAVQAQILEQEHVPVQDPNKGGSFGVVGTVPRKTRP